jgi:putative mRNA 3-end processing factor
VAVTVQYRDGIDIELSDGTRVVCDADVPDGDVTVVSHAHGDHLPTDGTAAVCSALTAAIGTSRMDDSLEATSEHRVELRPAGHVAGSRATLVEDPDGTRYCYTGDVCTRSRHYLDGFEPPDADVLVVEATYGKPEYRFPPHDVVVAEILDWLRDTAAPVLLLGYAFGRAQKLQLLAERADRARVLTTEGVLRINEPIEQALDVTFSAEEFDDTALRPGDALVLPMTSGRIDWVDRLASESGAVTAGFSGWAVDDSFRYRGDFDVTFPLSDHCDFTELVGLVEAVDPDSVYTQHGFAETLATELTARGFDATALKQNQTSLGQF